VAEKITKEMVEKLVDDIVKAEVVEKSMPNSTPANGGEDKIRSGSPYNEEEAAMDKKKKDEAKKAADSEDDKKDDKKDEDKEEEAKKAKMKKSEEVVKAEKKDDDKDEDDKDDKKDAKKKPAFMKKSIEELSSHLDEEELELVKAWREQPAVEETVAKSQAVESDDLAKSLSKAVESALEPLKKSLAEKDTLIKTMNEKIEKIASQPAYDRRSISTLETLEKAGANTQEISKSQIKEKLLSLQLAGKGVTSHHVAEFEGTNNISDARIRDLVFNELKIK
jgi:hypothetical protein